MSRKERRAAEHQARKAARKAGFPQPEPQPAAPQPEPVTEPKAVPVPEPKPAAVPPKKEISAAQLAANRANALRSTGPSPASFDKIANNALKHGLTGRAVVLPGEDADLYESRMHALEADFKPVGAEETELVQSLIDLRWRIGRIPGLESASLVVGRKILTDENPKLVAESDPVTLEFHIRQRFEKTFKNLSLHERHLVKRREKEAKELRQLQSARKAAEAAAAAAPPAKETKPPAPKPASPPSPPAAPPQPSPENGFVFENSEIDELLAAAPPELLDILSQEDLKPRETESEIAA